MYIEKHLIVILCALLLSTFLSGQIRGRLSLSEDQKTYEFYVTPNFSQGPPLSTTNSAQISIVAPTGGLEIVNFQSITGNWNGADVAIIPDPEENPGYSYVSIPLGSPMQDIVYEENVEILMFTFENGVECLGSLDIVDNETDPFLPPNSKSVNIGNLFTILTFGPTNVYDGTDICCAPCPGEELEEEEEMEEETEEPTEEEEEMEEETEEPVEEEEEMEEEIDATPPTGQGTLCTKTLISRIEIRLSAPGTPPYKAFWTNTVTGISDSMDIALIEGPYTLIDNAAPGIYEITLIDNTGRTLNLVEEVQDGGTYFLNPQLRITDVPCGATTSGRIAVTFPEDATGTYTYEWSNGMTNLSEIQDLSPDTYEVTVTDNNGCTNVQQATVGVEGGINADITLRNVSCLGRNDGGISVNISNPEAYTYQWEGNGITNTTSSLSDLTPGTYSVTISEPSGLCEQVKTVTINEPDALTLSARTTGTEPCEDAEEGTITIDNSNAQGRIQYALDGENFSTTNRFTVPRGETYTITAVDEMGCTTSTSVDLPKSSGLTLEAPENLILELGKEMELEVLHNATSDVNYKWAASESLSCTDCPNPIINPTQTTTYTLILSDDNGCSKEATIIVFIRKTDKIYTPNAFSPNNDGINDYFNIFTGINVEKVNSLQIFNRWGERVFQSTGDYVPNVAESGWNGTFNGKTMTPDVYVYFADITFKDGSSEVIKGEMNLMR